MVRFLRAVAARAALASGNMGGIYPYRPVSPRVLQRPARHAENASCNGSLAQGKNRNS